MLFSTCYGDGVAATACGGDIYTHASDKPVLLMFLIRGLQRRAPCSANDARRQSLSPEEARKLDARLAKVRDAYFRRLPESDPEYDEMQDLLKKAQDLAANATYAPGACTEDNNRRNAKRSRDA